MIVHHPTWCVTGETDVEPHYSATIHAAVADDIVDVGVRLFQIEIPLPTTLVEVEFVDDDSVIGHVLPVGQAKALANALNRLVADPTVAMRAIGLAPFRGIARHLRDRIADNEFVGGLPSDLQLADEYGVCRNTARRSLRILQLEGIVDYTMGSGWRLKDS